MTAPFVIGRIEEDWPGATVFVICGGLSVLDHDLNKLRGQKVVAINTSYLVVPFADFVFAIDGRWVRQHAHKLVDFAGTLVTCQTQINLPGMILLKKEKPPGLTDDRATIIARRTSLHGAINFIVHKGAKQIVLIGADAKKGANGKTHHHKMHPWPHKEDCWTEQHKDLVTVVEPLKQRGIMVFNTYEDNELGLWPYKPLEEFL